MDIAPNHGFRGTGVHLAIFRFRGVRIHNNARCRPGPVSVPQETFCCLMELQHHQFGSDAGHVERRFGSFGTQKEYRDCARVSWAPYIWHLPTLYNCFVVASICHLASAHVIQLFCCCFNIDYCHCPFEVNVWGEKCSGLKRLDGGFVASLPPPNPPKTKQTTTQTKGDMLAVGPGVTNDLGIEGVMLCRC